MVPLGRAGLQRGEDVGIEHVALGVLAGLLGPGVINVLPLTTDELEEAAQEPTAHRGVTFEPALLAELLTDVLGEPGALPLFQYALTELFDRRTGGQLTLEAYRSLGGVRGVLTRRADDLFHRLTLHEQEAARQLFLRLVTITEQEQWSRRRVPASEIVAIDVDVVTMQSVIDEFGRHRFLSFDRDHGTGAPTVEVAHEALLSEWDRLHGWIDEGRVDINRRAALAATLTEWNQCERDSDYLLSGKRLAEFERWRDATTMRLTTAEREYLDAALARRDDDAAAEAARLARERGLARRARRRWWALVAVVVGLAVAGAAAFVLGPGDPPSVAMVNLSGGSGTIHELLNDGLERATRDFELEPIKIEGPFSDIDDELASLAGSGTDLVVFTDFLFAESLATAAERYPDTTWAFVDIPVPGTPAFTFAEHEGAYLAGAAAALTSETGTIGYVGGMQIDTTERFRAGFEAGAQAVDPAIEIIATYTSLDTSGFMRDDLAREAAAAMYEQGADVVLHAAGAAGAGVFTAAREQSASLGRHVWAIGADSDQYLDVPPPERPHVLTSTIKRLDVAVYELIRDFLDGGLEPVRRELTVADGAVGYATTGGHLSPETTATLDRLEAEIVAGTRTVPRSPSGSLQPPPSRAIDHSATVTFDGSTCRYDGPTTVAPGATVHVEMVNTTDGDAFFDILSSNDVMVLDLPAPPQGTNEGYAELPAGSHTSWCVAAKPAGAVEVPGPDLEAPVGRSVATETALPSEPEAIARGFLDAAGDYDGERAMSYLTDDGIASIADTPEEAALSLAMMEAHRWKQTITGCEQQGDSPDSVTIRCTFDLHILGSDQLGLGPFGGNYWDLTIRDGKIFSVFQEFPFDTNGVAELMWDPLAEWIAAEHPEDVAVMYDAGQTMFRLTVESIRLWAQRVPEYVAAVGQG